MKYAHASTAFPSCRYLSAAMAFLATTTFLAALLTYGEETLVPTGKPAKANEAGAPASINLKIGGLDAPKEDDPGAYMEVSTTAWPPLLLQLDPNELAAIPWLEVRLTIDDPTKIRIHDNNTGTPSAILGAGVAVTEWKKSLADVALPNSDLTFGVEGVAPGAVHMTFELLFLGFSLLSDTVKLSIFEVDLDVNGNITLGDSVDGVAN